MVIRVGVLNDARAGGGETAEQERDSILRELREKWGGDLPDATLVWSSSDPGGLAGAPALDVLVVDYGALWQRGDLVDRYSRLVRRYADEHPNSVVLLWTEFTSHVYRGVFRSEFMGHDFVPAPGYPGWCGVDDCGRQRNDPLHGAHGVPAFNIMARYAPSGFRGMHQEYDEGFWPRLRSWLGR